LSVEPVSPGNGGTQAQTRRSQQAWWMEVPMKALLKSAALTLALVAGLGTAGAQLQTGAGLNSDLELTPQQRTAIYHALSKNKLHTPPPPLQLAIGADVPPSAELYTMPDNILSELPATKMYKYTVVQSQVVIVDPTTLKVIDILRQ
jgi:hypothetical protein